MFNKSFTQQHRKIGRVTAWAVFVLGVVYTITTILGFLSLKSPLDPIGNPYVSIMELLIIPLTLLYLISMVSIHAYATPEVKVYSLVALCLMIVLSCISSCVHFVVLAVGPEISATVKIWGSLLISWNWPSIVYALDILAWDWFFALSMLFASLVFKGSSGLEKSIRILMIISGVLSLAGLIGVPLGNMQIRNIGIIGYAIVSPVVFLLIGILFGRVPDNLLDTTKICEY